MVQLILRNRVAHLTLRDRLAQLPIGDLGDPANHLVSGGPINTQDRVAQLTPLDWEAHLTLRDRMAQITVRD